MFSCENETTVNSEPQLPNCTDSLAALHQIIDSLKSLTAQQLAEIKIRSKNDIENSEFTFNSNLLQSSDWYRATGVSVPWAKIYDGRDSNAQIIDSIPFKTPIEKVLDEALRNKIEYNGGKSGYISSRDMYEYLVFDYQAGYDYIVGLSKAVPYPGREIQITLSLIHI